MSAKKILSENMIQYEPMSVVDISGRVFYWQNRVFRAINDADVWERYRGIVQSPLMGELINAGMIETWIPEDVSLDGCVGVLEHKRVDFLSVLSEWTMHMLWDAAKMYLDVALVLAKHDLTFKDGHPWNVAFDYCAPKMIDFGSIISVNESSRWCDEFRIRFVAPLAAHKMKITRKLADEMLYEYVHGVGLTLLNSRVGAFFPYRLGVLIQRYKKAIQENKRLETVRIVEKMRGFLEELKPDVVKEEWADYIQMPEKEFAAQKAKADAVLAVLEEFQPDTVLDMGANKGWHAFMAESRGCKVVAFDYESYCVDQIYIRGKETKSRILPLRMNFSLPTASLGIALGYKDAYERFCSDVTLALGMTHHLSLRQNLRFSHIARIISKFTKRASAVEFVRPDDIHLRNWNIPEGYSQENFVKAMSEHGLELIRESRTMPTRSVLVFKKR